MHKLVREMAVARIRFFEESILSMDLLRAALIIDVAAAAVRAEMPGALFLVRSPIDAVEIAEWISTSSESGYSGTGDSQFNYHATDSPPEFTRVRSSDTYEFALFDDGILRPLDSEIEVLVRQVAGNGLNSLIELAHENQLGTDLGELSPSIEDALRMVGWNALVRSYRAVEGDVNSRSEGRSHTHLYWLRSLLRDWGPPLLAVTQQLLDTDVRVREAYAAVGEGMPWDAEGLRVFSTTVRNAQSDLHAARIDLVEIDVRTILDLSGAVGEPTALIAAVVGAYNWEGWSEDVPPDDEEGWLVPIRVISGTLPIFDFFDFEHESPTMVDGVEWNIRDDSLIDDLRQIDRSGMVRLDGIEIAGVRHSVVIGSDLFDDFCIIEFGN